MLPKLRSKNGFTLVELVVVLTALVICCSVFLPILCNYVRKAREERVLLQAKQLYRASYCILLEAHARGICFADAAQPPEQSALDYVRSQLDLSEMRGIRAELYGLTLTDEGEISTFWVFMDGYHCLRMLDNGQVSWELQREETG